MVELREALAAKRAVKAQEDAKEAKANEALRRKQGKVIFAIPAAVSASMICLLFRISTSLKRRLEPRR